MAAALPAVAPCASGSSRGGAGVRTMRRHTPAPYQPTGSDVQRLRDFIHGSRPPARESLLAALGAGLGPGADDANPQAAEGEDRRSKDSLAEFLFVRPTPAATTRATVAHLGNIAYAAAQEMVMVALPFINERVGGTVHTFSNLRVATNVLNLAGGVAMGAFSDRAGPKTALLVSHASAAASFFLVGAAGSVGALYLSALPIVSMHGYQTTMHVMTLNSDESQRARALGRVGSLYGVGMFLGSAALLGALPLVPPRAVALAAGGVELAVVALVAAVYPSVEDPAPSDVDEPEVDSWGARGASVLEVLRRPGILPLMAFKFVVVAAGGSVLFMVQQYAVHPFGYSASQAALLMAYLGGVQLLSQAVVTDEIRPASLYLTTALSVGGSLLGMAATPPSKQAFVLWLAPLTLFATSSRMMLGSLLTLYAPQEEMGTVLGFSMATVSVAHIVAVPISASIYASRGFSFVPLASGAFLLIATGVLCAVGFVPPSLPEPHGDADEPEADAALDDEDPQFS